MKLDSIKVFVVGNPPPGFGGRYFVFLKLTTSCGIEGVGEVYAATFGPHVVAAMIEDEATVKTFFRASGHTWLIPQNIGYEPIPGDRCRLLGKVVTTISRT